MKKASETLQVTVQRDTTGDSTNIVDRRIIQFHLVIIMLLSSCTGQTDEEGQRDAASDSAERHGR